jgi:hypothetical protein
MNWRPAASKALNLLILPWLYRRFIASRAKRVPKQLLELLELAAAGNIEKVPAPVAEALEAIKRAHFEEQMGRLLAAQSEAEAKIRESLAKNDRLAEEAKAARERGRK